MASLVATNLILLFLAIVGWTGFFTLAYTLMNVSCVEMGKGEEKE